MINTPRTDVAIANSKSPWIYGKELADFCRQLERELAATQKDAARYRWLRGAGAWESEIGMDVLSENPEAFDAAVDARMNTG